MYVYTLRYVDIMYHCICTHYIIKIYMHYIIHIGYLLAVDILFNIRYKALLIIFIDFFFLPRFLNLSKIEANLRNLV